MANDWFFVALCFTLQLLQLIPDSLFLIEFSNKMR